MFAALACAPDREVVDLRGLEEHLVVWVELDGHGEIRQALSITGGAHWATREDDALSALVIVRLDDLVDEYGRRLGVEDIAVSRVADSKSTECACGFFALGPPQLLMPGRACPVAPFAEVRSNRGRLSPEVAASIPRGLRLSLVGECRPDLRVARSSPPFEVDMVAPAEDAEPFRLGVRTAAGDVVFASERRLLLIAPDGTRRWLAVPFRGPIVALEPFGDNEVLAVSLVLESRTLELFAIGATGARSAGSIPDGLSFSGSQRGARTARMADGSVWVFVAQSEASFPVSSLLAVTCIPNRECGQPERLLIRSEDNLGGPAIGFASSAIIPMQRAAPLVIERRAEGFGHSRPEWSNALDIGLSATMAHLGGEAVACGLQEDGLNAAVVSTAGGRGPWRTVLTSIHDCALIEGPEQVIAAFSDGQAALIGVDGSARVARSSELGIDLKSLVPRTVGARFLATNTEGQWIESDAREFRRVLYGRPSEVDFPDPMTVRGARPIAEVGSGIFKELGAEPRAFELPNLAGDTAGMAFDAAGFLWVVGSTRSKGFAARVELDTRSVTPIELPEVPGLVGVAVLTGGRAIAVGEDWTIVDLSAESGELVDFGWDDSMVDGVDSAPQLSDCLRDRPPIRPHTWVDVSSRGDGVAWLSGCGGAFARAVASPKGLTISRIVLPDEFVRLHDSRLAELTWVRSLGVSGAVIVSPGERSNRLGVIEVSTSAGSSRGDGLVFERLNRPGSALGGLAQGSPLGMYVDDEGHLTTVSAHYPEEVIIDRPFASAQRRLDFRAATAVAGSGSRVWIASTYGRLAEVQ